VDFHFLYHGQRFVWNVEKASANVAKHGIRFEAACQVFLDPLLQMEDAGEAAGEAEPRVAAIGITEDRKLLYVVHVMRERETIRIISARLATAHERRFYEDNQ
jgi:hypothetical protein